VVILVKKKRSKVKSKTGNRPIEAKASMVSRTEKVREHAHERNAVHDIHGTKRRSIGELKTQLCPPCRYTWEGPALLIIGLLGLLNYFGILNLSLLNWPLLEPIIVMILGLLIISGVLHK
jgi:hypothetical protein